jgi:hypothetical protein
MRKYVDAWPQRVWAVEGSSGAGRPLAQRLFEDGERVVDVPAKLAARRIPALETDTDPRLWRAKKSAVRPCTVTAIGARIAADRMPERRRQSGLDRPVDDGHQFDDHRLRDTDDVPLRDH